MFCENARWTSICINNDYCPVRALINKAEGFSNSAVTGHRDGCFIDRVSRFYESHNVLYNVKRNVLRKNYKPAPACNGLGHTSACNSCHVRYDYRNSGSQSIGCAQIDSLSRLNIGQARNHEYVVICQVVVRRSVQKLHEDSPCSRLGKMPKPCFTTALGYSEFVAS